MTSAIEGSIGIAAYLALFAGVGIVFVFVNLLVGRFLRPDNPHQEKGEVYECGEPTIGSSFVQFDLRFYVVALIFIIFDVEVAFLFPWATVFGKATNLMHTESIVATADAGLGADVSAVYQELGVRHPTLVGGASAASQAVHDGAQTLLALATIEVLVFFLILLIAYAYEWRLGALDWVRALTEEHRQPAAERKTPGSDQAREPVLSA